MLLCCKDSFFLGWLENTGPASHLLSLLPHPLISMSWASCIFMFYPCLLQNTAAKWWGSSVVSDLEELWMFFLLDSAIEGSWIIFSCVPVMYVKGRMLTQNNRAGQSAPVLSWEGKSLINGENVYSWQQRTASFTAGFRLSPDLPRAAVMRAWFACAVVCYEDVKSELDGWAAPSAFFFSF